MAVCAILVSERRAGLIAVGIAFAVLTLSLVSINRIYKTQAGVRIVGVKV